MTGVRWLVLSLILASAVPARAAQVRNERIGEALRRGMDYMIRSALVKANFDAFASDYLFFFADVSRYQDPWIAERARTVGLALGDYYLDNLFSTATADEIVDAASALWALDVLGYDVDPALAVLQRAAPDHAVEEYLCFEPTAGGLPDLDLLIDLVIGFHFTDRMGVDIGVTYAEVLPHVAGVDYRVDAALEENRYIDTNNLVTHLVYTLTGYATWNAPARALDREVAYIRAHMADALIWADPETLSEYVDSLKLVGFGPQDPDVAAGEAVLLAIQRPDGRWIPDEVEDEYDRYHATWCAMDALVDYALPGGDRLPDPVTAWVLGRWASDGAGEDRVVPWMPIGADRVAPEDF